MHSGSLQRIPWAAHGKNPAFARSKHMRFERGPANRVIAEEVDEFQVTAGGRQHGAFFVRGTVEEIIGGGFDHPVLW
jgi:hypothetical protein